LKKETKCGINSIHCTS